MNERKEIKPSSKGYNPTNIFFVILFYFIIIIALLQYRLMFLFSNFANTIVASIFLAISFLASIRIFGFNKYYLNIIELPYYLGMIMCKLIYLLVYFIEWALFKDLAVGIFLILNMIILFIYLLSTITIFLFAKKQKKKEFNI